MSLFTNSQFDFVHSVTYDNAMALTHDHVYSQYTIHNSPKLLPKMLTLSPSQIFMWPPTCDQMHLAWSEYKQLKWYSCLNSSRWQWLTICILIFCKKKYKYTTYFFHTINTGLVKVIQIISQKTTNYLLLCCECWWPSNWASATILLTYHSEYSAWTLAYYDHILLMTVPGTLLLTELS